MSVGKMLFNQQIAPTAIKRRGPFRLAVELISAIAANNFVSNKKFKTLGLNIAFISQRLLTCRGIVRRVGSDITDMDILEFGQCDAGIRKVRILET